MADLRELLGVTAGLAADFYDSLPERAVFPPATADELRAAFSVPLPAGPTDPSTVIAELAAAAEPGLVAEPSGRYGGRLGRRARRPDRRTAGPRGRRRPPPRHDRPRAPHARPWRADRCAPDG